MTELPTLGHQMFLSQEIAAYVDHVNRTHAPSLSYAKRLNELAHRALFCMQISRNNLQHVLLATLLQRGLKAFQATVLLLERGLPEEGQVALRTLLEVTFKTVAVAKNKDAADAFVREDEAHRRKFINKYKRLSAGAQDSLARTELDTVLVGCQARIQENGAKELGTYWFAEKAEMLDFYNSAYAVLSSTVHANIRTLESALDIGEDGEIRRITYGFSDVFIDENLLTASEAMLFTLQAGFSMGDIPESDIAAINAAQAELNTLHQAIYKEV